MTKPIFLILTGATGNARRIASCEELAREYWPEARVFMPNYLSRLRGVRDVGEWLEGWLKRMIEPEAPIFIFAFILGGAVLPYAPTLMKRARKVVLLRSRYQEGVPRLLRRKLGRWGTTLVASRAVAELGTEEFWPYDFQLPCPQRILVETVPTPLARWLGVDCLSDDELKIVDYKEMAIDHNSAYHSRELMKEVTEWLKA